MKNKYVAILLSFFILALLVLLVSAAYFFFKSDSLERSLEANISEVASLNAELGLAYGNISDLSDMLDETNSELSATNDLLLATSIELNSTKDELDNALLELHETSTELNRTSELLHETRAEIVELKEEINEVGESVNASVQWFKDNSEIPPSLDGFMARTDLKCVGSGYLNLGCIPYVMGDRLDFIYKFEIQDRLYSIDEMVRNQGGDCEDYSLFLKAYLTSFRETYGDIRLKAWVDSPGDEFIIYEEGKQYWYYEGESISLGSLEDLNPYVMCYNTYYDGTTKQGHCIIALSKVEVDSVDDLEGMIGSNAFEPQNGRYMGVVGDDFYMCRKGEYECGDEVGAIVFIITNDDLYQFLGDEWKNYKLYQESISDIEKEMDDFLDTS